MVNNNLNNLSTGQPTYWPTDRGKIPDVIDFCIMKGISSNYLKAESCLDLSSYHSPVIITHSTQILRKQKSPAVHNKRTNRVLSREIIDRRFQLNIPLKTEEQNDAVEQFTNDIKKAAWEATPEQSDTKKRRGLSPVNKEKIAEKRRIRKAWQNSRSPNEKHG
jgi:hypothetical protein